VIRTSKILPDEFSRGYSGRLKSLNCHIHPNKVISALLANFFPQDSELVDRSEASALAMAADMPFSIFAQSHSLLPLFQMVPPAEKSAKYGKCAQANMSVTHAIRCWERIGARFCMKCVSEEVNSRGYAIWHRSHQLPGVCWCAVHETQLAISANAKNGFDDMPSIELESSYEFAEDEFEAIHSNPVIQRYADIIFTILNSNKPLSSIHAIYRMAELLRGDDIRVGKNGQRPTLTDRLLDQVPAAWLHSHYPSLNSRAQGEYFHAIDSIASRPVANPVYVLGLASLFESSKDAIDYWFSSTDNLPNARKSKRRYERGYWSSDELCKLYVELRCSYKKISETVGTDLTHTKKMLKAAGWPALRNPDMAAMGEAIAEIRLGMPIEVACASNGVQQVDIEKLLKCDIDKLLRAIKDAGSVGQNEGVVDQKEDCLAEIPEFECI